jgi:probable rRNA maturation factor
MKSAAALKIDVVVDCQGWPSDAAALVRRAIVQAAGTADGGVFAGKTFAGKFLAVLLTDDAAVRALNAAWRGIDKPTNVLSFPAPRGERRYAPVPLGDIAIACETTAREAQAEGKPLAHHLSHLAVHGFLHLLGYDHESDREAEAMEQLERKVLAALGVPDPYLTQGNLSEDARV